MAKNLTNLTRNRQKEAFLKSLSLGSSISEFAEAAGVTRVTIWLWRKKYKGFDDKVLSIIDSRTQSVEDALYASAIKGNVVAQIFWLKNRGKDRWKDKFEQKVEVEEELKIIDTKKKLISKLDSLAIKKRERRDIK